MSKPRTEIQKMRRAYIDQCHKDGITPLPVDKWLKGDSAKKPTPAKKSKPAKKDSNPKKVAAKSETHKKESGRKVTIRHGDKVVLDGYTSHELFEIACRIACSAIGLATMELSRGN